MLKTKPIKIERQKHKFLHNVCRYQQKLLIHNHTNLIILVLVKNNRWRFN